MTLARVENQGSFKDQWLLSKLMQPEVSPLDVQPEGMTQDTQEMDHKIIGLKHYHNDGLFQNILYILICIIVKGRLKHVCFLTLHYLLSAQRV